MNYCLYLVIMLLFCVFVGVVLAYLKTHDAPISIIQETEFYFPITSAVLCIQCNNIFSSKKFMKCPACGNEQNYFIQLAFNPTLQETIKELQHRMRH